MEWVIFTSLTFFPDLRFQELRTTRVVTIPYKKPIFRLHIVGISSLFSSPAALRLFSTLQSCQLLVNFLDIFLKLALPIACIIIMLYRSKKIIDSTLYVTNFSANFLGS